MQHCPDLQDGASRSAAGMMATAGRTNHMIVGNTMWNPAYRQHVWQNMARTGGRQRAAPSTVSDVHVASASASPSARPFYSWAHISRRHPWATPSVASRVRSCRTGRGSKPSGFALFLPRPIGSIASRTSRVKASPGILTRSLRCASGCGFRSRP